MRQEQAAALQGVSEKVRFEHLLKEVRDLVLQVSERYMLQTERTKAEAPR